MIPQPIMALHPSNAVFPQTAEAARELANESSRQTGGWNPLVVGCVTALEDAVKSVRASTAKAFADRVIVESNWGRPEDAVLVGLEEAASYAKQLRETLRHAPHAPQAEEWMEMIESRTKGVMWLNDTLEDSFYGYTPDLSAAVESEASLRRVPQELVWAFIDLHDATSDAVRAVLGTARVRPLREIVADAIVSIECSARAREHAAIARVRDEARGEIDESSAAMLRRIRWAISGGRLARENPSPKRRSRW